MGATAIGLEDRGFGSGARPPLRVTLYCADPMAALVEEIARNLRGLGFYADVVSGPAARAALIDGRGRSPRGVEVLCVPAAVRPTVADPLLRALDQTPGRRVWVAPLDVALPLRLVEPIRRFATGPQAVVPPQAPRRRVVRIALGAAAVLVAGAVASAAATPTPASAHAGLTAPRLDSVATTPPPLPPVPGPTPMARADEPSTESPGAPAAALKTTLQVHLPGTHATGDWGSARRACRRVTHDGWDGFRLPLRREIRLLGATGRVPGGTYWTATSDPGDEEIAFVYNTQRRSMGHWLKVEDGGAVVCVRAVAWKSS